MAGKMTRQQVADSSGFPLAVFTQYEQVQQDGRTNMLDRAGVMRVAADLELWDLYNAAQGLGRHGWGEFVMVRVSDYLQARGS